MAAAPSSKNEDEISNATHQSAVGRASMGAHTSCVTCAIDLSPSIRGGRNAIAASAMMFFLAFLFPLWGAIAHDGQISDGRTDIQFFEHSITPRVRHHLADLTLGVVEIAEVDCLRRARLLARRLDSAIGHFLA